MAAKEKRFEFVVEGSGVFPFDMLRYDTCWPRGENDASGLDAHPRSGGWKGRTVKMRGLKTPTTGRWQSFGWKVFDVEERTIG